MLAAVEDVSAMPKETDTAGLTQTLDLIQTKQKQLKAKADQCDQAEQEMVGLKGEFDSWVDDNPVCPTCGSETDTQHVLKQHGHSQAKASGGARG